MAGCAAAGKGGATGSKETLLTGANPIVPILDAFHAANWPLTIEYLSNAVDPQRLHQAVRRPNYGFEPNTIWRSGRTDLLAPSFIVTASDLPVICQ
jgi:hypothetical protein